MNFLKNKVKKFQEKKLQEANKKLKSHTEIKNQLEQFKTMNNDDSIEISKKIRKQKELIGIWEKNIEVIKKQLKKFNLSYYIL